MYKRVLISKDLFHLYLMNPVGKAANVMFCVQSTVVTHIYNDITSGSRRLSKKISWLTVSMVSQEKSALFSCFLKTWLTEFCTMWNCICSKYTKKKKMWSTCKYLSYVLVGWGWSHAHTAGYNIMPHYGNEFINHRNHIRALLCMFVHWVAHLSPPLTIITLILAKLELQTYM